MSSIVFVGSLLVRGEYAEVGEVGWHRIVRLHPRR